MPPSAPGQGRDLRGTISVSSTIVDYLSSGLYRTPAACLKELINNAYDADATRVRVFVKPDAERLIVADDGTGLSDAEFESHFRRIAESRKRLESDTTPSGRRKIGKIGIGFIAANEICDAIEIVSTKAGSTDLLTVRIDFAAMRSSAAERRAASGDVAKADYVGRVTPEAKAADHFTEVHLTRIRREAQAILIDPGSQSGRSGESSLYGRRPETVRRILCSGIRTWSDLDRYSQNLLQVGLYTPVPYLPDWMPADQEREIAWVQNRTDQLSFSVTYDGADLRRPIVFCGQSRAHFVSRFKHNGRHVSAEGYFYVQHGVIQPQELNGALIRIREASVGDYDPTFLDFPSSIGIVFQRWISGEVWASDHLEDALNIDRRTLRAAHPAYVELRSAIHAHLHKVIAKARLELYASQARERRSSKIEHAAADLRSVADDVVRPVDPQAARQIIAAWERSEDEEGTDRDLLRRYSVADLYRVVVAVASDVLTPDLRRAFLSELTKRLRQ